MHSATSDRAPFGQRCVAIRAQIDAGEQIAPLLRGLGASTDPALLAFAIEQLVERGRLEPAIGLGPVLADVSDGHLGRALRGIEQPPPALVDHVAAALDRLTPDRVAAACFLMRWLARAAPDRWAAIEAQAIATARAGVRDGSDAVDDATLMRIPGRVWPTLDAAGDTRWPARRARFAARVLDALAAQPKSLSQIGAEALLARRVYTQPTHFLMELVQNADDAGAGSWSLAVDPERLVVQHDGTPFDARDVVGVLSIGQTTKSVDQIGQFGVGFKSVYAVTDRPRLHAEPFHFEIADVSIPRRLDPVSIEPGVTRLVLPLRTPDDPLAGRAAIEQGAAALPGALLLTLRNLQRIEIATGGGRRRIARRVVDGVIEVDDGHRWRWRVAEGDADHAESAARSVRVALLLDDDGRPRPLPRRVPQVFCFLPTRDRPGLRFMVHGRFPLPVDRERVDPDAHATRVILAEAGRCLARLVAGSEQVWPLLEVAPSPGELPARPWSALFDAFVDDLRTGVLPAPDDTRIPVERAMWSPPGPLADALADVALPGERRLVVPPTSRTQAIVEAVGVVRVDAATVLATLETEPRWPVTRLAPLLTHVIEACADPAFAARLRRVPCLVGADGVHRAAVDLEWCAAELRPVFAHRDLLADTLADDPVLAALWPALGVRVLSDTDLVVELENTEAREIVLTAVTASDLHDWMEGLEARLLGRLATVPLVPDQTGRLRPARGSHALVQAGADALGRWAIACEPAPLPLLDPAMARARPTLISRLRIRPLDLDRLIAEAHIDGAHIAGLHRALDTVADDLSPRRAERLAHRPWFPAVDGTLRPLRGPGAAVRAAVPDLVQLVPEAPWLAASLAGARHVELIGPATAGFAEVVAALHDPTSPLYSAPDTARHRALRAWICANPGVLGTHRRAAAAEAAIWHPADGSLPVPLAELRLPAAEPAWQALYAVWPRRRAPAAEAVELAAALGLDHVLAPPDAEAVALDLAEGTPPDAALPLMDRVVAAIGRLGSDADARRVAAVGLHLDADGDRRTLGGWSTGDEGGAHRAEGALRAALAEGTRALLDAAYQAGIEPLLDALGMRPATTADLLASHRHTPLDAQVVRRALVDGLPSDDADARRAWSAVPLWPTAAGELEPATAVCLAVALADLPPAAVMAVPAHARVADEARDDAERLATRLDFADPAVIVRHAVERDARLGQPLSAQVEWLASVEHVAAVRRIVGPDAPAWVDLAGHLVSGPLYRVDPDGRRLAEQTDLRTRIAHPADPDLDAVRPLPARMLLAALADAAPEPTTCATHPLLGAPAVRQTLYRWLDAQADELDADEQARGQLGRACLWPTRAGRLLAPRALLPFEPDDPLARALGEDPALDGWLADEVPPAVRAHLQRWFRLDARRLRTAVDALVQAHRAIVDAGDVERSARLLEALGGLVRSAVRPDADADTLVARYKLHRRVKAADGAGAFHRTRDLLVPDAADEGAELALWLDAPPPTVSAQYGPDARWLLARAGAPASLPLDQLLHALDAPLGAGARRARARYVARRAAARPALIDRLGLATRAWLVDQGDEAAAPGQLHWPGPELDAILGPDRGRRPHPDVQISMPASVKARLPFAGVLDLPPALVAARLRDGRPAPPAVLRWFDDALLAGRLDAAAARAVLAGRAVFPDDDGRCRPPAELVRDMRAGALGRRRGGFAEGRSVPRLLGALGIPTEVGARVVEGLLGELADAVRRGRTRLEAEPELNDVVPPWIERLAHADRARPPLVVARGPTGWSLCPTDADDLSWPDPPALADAALEAGAAIRLVVVPGPPPAVPLDWRLPTIESRWSALDVKVDGRRDDALDDRIGALWAVLPRCLADPPSRPAVRRVARADRPGTIGGTRVDWPRAAAVIDGALCVDPTADEHDIAAALVGDLLLPAHDRRRAALTDRLERLLHCGTVTAMGLLLDAEGLADHAPVIPPAAPPAEASTRRDVARVDDEPALSPDPPAPDPAALDDEAGDGLWSRFRRWWQGDDDAPDEPDASASRPAPRTPRTPPPNESAGRRAPPEPPSRPDEGDSTAFRPPDTTRFFDPQSAVESQLRANPQWLATRQTPTEIGFAFAPGRLPGAHQYGPMLIADRYDRRGRRWLPAAVDPAWSAPPGGGRYRVAFTGRLPTGRSVLPIPLYARVIDVTADGDVRRSVLPGGRPMLFTRAPTDVRFTVELSGGPRFDDREATAPDTLMAPTVPDGELPAECHGLVEQILALSPRDRVAAIGRFVQTRYRYDPSYLEDPAHARWLRRVSRGRANPHLAALHAARDGRHLGAGVCYELNVLVCELCRRVGVPAAVATGWTFDRGWVDQPDHLWAMALLSTADGLRWLPVDASTTRDGRPLHASPRPPGPHRARTPRQNGAPPRAPSWGDRPRTPAADPVPLADLVRVIRHAEKVAGRSAPSDGERLAAARRLLDDPGRVQALLELLDQAREE